jgi:GNAT superfamily N-acetyltransferase
MITYLEANEAIRDRLEREWGPKAASHMHLTDGFSIVALENDTLVGLISACWKKLPPPLPDTFEGYVDILEVHEAHRRKGIARQLISIVCERAKSKGVYQLRAWSSEDKIEAIPMWKALGFGLCPVVTHPQGRDVTGYFVTKVL